MKVAELMSPSIITVERQTPLRHVLQLMLRFHLNDVLVVDNWHDLAGIVTYSDLIRSLLPSDLGGHSNPAIRGHLKTGQWSN